MNKKKKKKGLVHHRFWWFGRVKCAFCHYWHPREITIGVFSVGGLMDDGIHPHRSHMWLCPECNKAVSHTN